MWRPHCACSSIHSRRSTPGHRCPKTRRHTCPTASTDAKLFDVPCAVSVGDACLDSVWRAFVQQAQQAYATSAYCFTQKHLPGEPRISSAMLAMRCMQLHMQYCLHQAAPEVCLSKCLRPNTIASCIGGHSVHNVPWRGFYSRIPSILHHTRFTLSARCGSAFLAIFGSVWAANALL